MANFIGHVVRQAAVGGLLCAGMLAAAGCGKRDAAAASDKKPPAVVNVIPAIAQTVPVYLDEIGKTTASAMVTVMPQVSGRLEALHFVDGADVSKDSILFTIDARPFTAAWQQAVAQLAKDKATSDNAEAFFKKQADVWSQKFISESDYDTARFN